MKEIKKKAKEVVDKTAKKSKKAQELKKEKEIEDMDNISSEFFAPKKGSKKKFNRLS